MNSQALMIALLAASGDQFIGLDRRMVFCEPVKPKKTVKRNQPCPCGSGKKSKRCCRGETQPASPTPNSPSV